MTVMNPYYAHASSVGDVFDVAHFSRGKSLFTGLIGIGFGAAIAFAAAYVWNPDAILQEPSEIWAEAHQDLKDLQVDHPVGVQVGVGVAGLFALLCVIGGLTCFANAATAGFYLRVGEGGLSVRAPEVIGRPFEQDYAWEEIEKLTVVQHKRLGAMSRGDGNLGGELEIRVATGKTRVVRLDDFREDAWLIYDRIEEARQMRSGLCPEGEELEPELVG